jgi:hypothetical protein
MSSSIASPFHIGANESRDGMSEISPTKRSTVSSSNVSPARASATAVAARYSAPESTWRNPSRCATHCAVDDFPDAAGPSIATTSEPPGLRMRGVDGGVGALTGHRTFG